MDTSERNRMTWESSKENQHSIIITYVFIQSKRIFQDPKLQLVKLLTATKFHDIIGMLDTHLNQDEVDMMVKNNKKAFQELHNPIVIPSQSRGMMVLLRKSSPFKLVIYKYITSNCLSVKLESASNQ